MVTKCSPKGEPQYIIKSDKTDHIAIHKGKALKRIRGANPGRRRYSKKHHRKFSVSLLSADVFFLGIGLVKAV